MICEVCGRDTEDHLRLCTSSPWYRAGYEFLGTESITWDCGTCGSVVSTPARHTDWHLTH